MIGNYIRCFNPSVHQVFFFFFYGGVQQRPGMEGHIARWILWIIQIYNVYSEPIGLSLRWITVWPTWWKSLVSWPKKSDLELIPQHDSWLAVNSDQCQSSLFFWGGTSSSYHFSEHTPDEKDWITASICFWHASIVHVLQIYQMWGSKHIKTIQCHIELQRNR